MSGIISIGTDIVHIPRLEKAWQRWGNRFAGKVLHDAEQAMFAELGSDQDCTTFLAKRFCAKEAVAKCLGTGLKGGVTLAQIEVIRGRHGRPGIKLHGRAAEVAKKLGGEQVMLSLSDEKEYAVAFAVLSA